MSADGERWCLLNASPDLPAQLQATPSLHPQARPRHSPLGAVVLTSAEIDHVAGLLSLREGHPFDIYATRRVFDTLSASPIFDALDRNLVRRRPVELGAKVALEGDLAVEFFAVPGKVALYLEGGTPEIGAQTEDTVGLRLEGGGGTFFFFVPGCAELTPELAARLRGAQLLFFDGTLWRDDEMIRTGTGSKTGRRMGHMSMAGPAGSLAAFAGLDVARKVYIHINNTNPVLIDDAPEREVVTAAGWEVAWDGMEIELPCAR